jgi:D-alanyl-lipoteichoic acid acyltransferase DltB (MBOAT superfamily)
MACGTALFFGVRLPANFESPLKASNIIDFWLRWHISLTRFLTAYIFNPIALVISRRRAAKGLPMLAGRGSSMSAFFHVLAWPTLATMLVAGIWHGAGYTFILWGLLHGFFLIINHAWRQYRPRSASAKGLSKHFANLGGFALTFFAVVCGMVLFRAPDLASAANVLKGMTGFHGVGLPSKLAEMAGAPSFGPMVLLDGEVSMMTFAAATAYLVGLLAIALALPNSLQAMSKYEPVLQRQKQLSGATASFLWHPTLPWMGFTAVLAAYSMMQITAKSEFLYWQF